MGMIPSGYEDEIEAQRLIPVVPGNFTHPGTDIFEITPGGLRNTFTAKPGIPRVFMTDCLYCIALKGNLSYIGINAVYCKYRNIEGCAPPEPPEPPEPGDPPPDDPPPEPPPIPPDPPEPPDSNCKLVIKYTGAKTKKKTWDYEIIGNGCQFVEGDTDSWSREDDVVEFSSNQYRYYKYDQAVYVNDNDSYIRHDYENDIHCEESRPNKHWNTYFVVYSYHWLFGVYPSYKRYISSYSMYGGNNSGIPGMNTTLNIETESGGKISLSCDENEFYNNDPPPPEPDPPPPPPDGDDDDDDDEREDDMKCCSRSQCRDIEDMLRKVVHGGGFNKYPATLPSTLIGDSADATTKVESLSDMIVWFVQQFDAVLGEYPIDIEIEDIDPSKEGNQNRKITLPNLSEAIAEIYSLSLKNGVDGDIHTRFLMRLAAEAVANKNISAITQSYAKANAQFLGYKATPKEYELKYAFDPNNLDKLEDILEDSVGGIEGWSNEDDNTAMDYFQRLMFAASIIKSRFFRPAGEVSKVVGEISRLASGSKEDKQKAGKLWEEFINSITKERNGIKPDIDLK